MSARHCSCAWNVIVILSLVLVQTVLSQRQRIIGQPQNTQVLLGQTAVLACRVFNQEGQVQWTRDDFALGSERTLPAFARLSMVGSSAEGEYNLEIKNVNVEDDAEYRCQLFKTERQPGDMSEKVHLTVLVPPNPPKLTTHGDVIVAKTMDLLPVGCRSEGGKPAPTIRWVVAHDTQGHRVIREMPGTEAVVALPRPHEKLSTVTSELSYKPEATDDQKYLVCLVNWCADKKCGADVSADFTTMASAALLNISYTPTVSIKPELVDTSQVGRREGSSLTLRCSVQAKPKETSYAWFMNGELIANENAATYKVDKLRKATHHKAIFTCQAGNELGFGNASFLVDMQYPPEAYKLPQYDFLLGDRDNVTLTCPVHGNPPPIITWSLQTSREVLHRGENYTVSNLDLSSVKQYTCTATVVSVPEFHAVSVNFTVRVKGPPEVQRNRHQEVSAGQEAELRCRVGGQPEPTDVKWLRRKRCDGTDAWLTIPETVDHNGLSRYEGYHYKQQSGVATTRTVKREADGTIVFILFIQNVNEADFACYNCTASNEFGHSSDKFALTEAEAVPIYLMIPGVIGGCVAILLITILFVCLNKKHLCTSKSSSTFDDRDSDVTVKVEALDGPMHHRYYPDMYATADTGDYVGKDYAPLPLQERDIDNLPPPYTRFYHNHSPTTFASNGSLPKTGQLVHMTYLDDSPQQQYSTESNSSALLLGSPMLANSGATYHAQSIHHTNSSDYLLPNVNGASTTGYGAYVAAKNGGVPNRLSHSADPLYPSGGGILSNGYQPLIRTTNPSTFLPGSSSLFVDGSLLGPPYLLSPHSTPLETLHEVPTPEIQDGVHGVEDATMPVVTTVSETRLAFSHHATHV